ncbi:MAG: hypothetical protein K0Q77_44 [Anaerosporomusa subterranea]|jgi:hypothetical protein|nr:hypothetical protein [Anaerosporomusa subterranea]MDF2572313.1 hypothetical protein [Sporomusa sp.]
MRKITRKYKGWTIKQDLECSGDGISHDVYRCYTPDEMEYPANMRSSEWDAGSMQEAEVFIDSY